MWILPRYVLVELVKTFIMALVGLSGAMVLVGLIQEAIRQGLPAMQILRILPYVLPDVLRLTVPVTLLLATIMVYSRMSTTNEIVALKSAGVSPLTILRPTFIMAFLVSLVTVWLNDGAYSWGRKGLERVAVDAAAEIAYSLLQSQRCYSTQRFTIRVKSVVGRRLLRPLVTLSGQGDASTLAITAEEAELRTDRGDDALTIVLRNGSIARGNQGKFSFPDVFEQEIPLSGASRANGNASSPPCIPLSQIGDAIRQQQEAIRDHEQKLAVLAARPASDRQAQLEWQTANDQMGAMRKHLSRLQAEPPRRWAAGFSCLGFVWIGAPMAIRLRRGEPLGAFFLCFAPILIVYYPLLIFGINGAKNGTVPPMSLWAGNLVLFVWGTWLLRRVLRY